MILIKKQFYWLHKQNKVDDGQKNDTVMAMYNLIEYSDAILF